MSSKSNDLNFILPKAGLLFSDRGGQTEILCKPKLLAIKSAELNRLESMEKSVNAGSTGQSTSTGNSSTNTSSR